MATPRTQLSTGDLYRLASDFAQEHGIHACDYAWRAVSSFEAEGDSNRAYFWFLLLVMLGDIVTHRIQPDAAITIH